MTEKCAREGCTFDKTGTCLEHDTVQKNLNSLKKCLQKVPNLTKLFWVCFASQALIISGLALSFATQAHQDSKVEEKFNLLSENFSRNLAEVEQQSITRDHLVVTDIKADREVQMRIVGMVEAVVVKTDNTAEDIDELKKLIRELL